MIVVAAGEGKRAGSALPKQYIKLHGREIISHTICNAYTPCLSNIIAVIKNGDDALYNDAMLSIPSNVRDKLLAPAYGGKRRQDSVRIGLESIEHLDPDFIIIHDACRPFAGAILEKHAIESVLDKYVGIVPALPPVDTVAAVRDGAVVDTINRDYLRAIQTPQIYRYKDALMCHRKVYSSAPDKHFTDDSAVMLECGMPVAVIEGSYGNFKITTVEDIHRAEMRMYNKS